MKKAALSILVLVLAFACQTAKNFKQEENKKLQRVKELFNEAEKLKLPLVWKNTMDWENGSLEYPVVKKKLIKLNPADSIFFENEPFLNVLIGVVPDTTFFYTFLLAYQVESIFPVLVTIDKQGNIVDRLKTGYGCGADFGYRCEASFFLNENLSFKSQRKEYSAEPLDNYTDIDTSKVIYKVSEKRGIISQKGNISEHKQRVVEEREIPFSSKENPIKYTK